MSCLTFFLLSGQYILGGILIKRRRRLQAVGLMLGGAQKKAHFNIPYRFTFLFVGVTAKSHKYYSITIDSQREMVMTIPQSAKDMNSNESGIVIETNKSLQYADDML